MSPYDNENMKKAVALRTDKEGSSPIVIASGLGPVAERIVKTALDNSVPVYEDSTLATILSQIKLSGKVPDELYQSIIEIYMYLISLGDNPGLEEIFKDEPKDDEKVQQYQENNEIKSEIRK